MHLHDSFLAIIPARGGSKGIIGKNLKKIGKKPMIQFTIEAALSCINPNNILVTSDNDDIINLSTKLGLAVPFKRPEELSTDSAKTSDVIQHAIEFYQNKYNNLPRNILLLQPTSPFRNLDDIRSAISKFNLSDKKTLVSAVEPIQHPCDCILKNNDGKFQRLSVGDNIYGRQKYPEVLYIDGGIYIANTEYFLETQDLIGDDPEVYITNQFNAIDIDTPFDLEWARAMHNYRLTNE